MAEEKLTKSGKPDKRFKSKEEPAGHIQDVIASKQAPGVVIPAEHQSAPKASAGVDPNVAVDWSHLNDNGKTAMTKGN